MKEQFLPGVRPFFLGAAVFGTSFLASTPALSAAVIPDRVTFVAGDTVRMIEKDRILPWFTVTRKAVYDANRTAEIESVPAIWSRFPFFSEGFIPRATWHHMVTDQSIAINHEQLNTSLMALIDELERDPINAKLAIDAAGQLTVTSEAVMGLTLYPAASLQQTIQTLDDTPGNTDIKIPLPVKMIPAKVSRDTVDHLGLHTTLAEGKTNFRGSPKNRIFNIYRAIEQYDGVVILPGDEFSFVDYLGEVDGEHGYLPELVIKHNKTEPEFGGGICQVSTTVFRAAIQAGLEITERKNHAYPVQYYKPYGMDATIYIPRPDLKFRNNTPGSILMLPKIVGTELTFTFYGTSDGRTTTIDGPYILESNPDGSMRTIFTQTVKDKEGNILVNSTFPSNYKSPSLFPHPGEEILTEKPKDWSARQWKAYKAIHP